MLLGWNPSTGSLTSAAQAHRPGRRGRPPSKTCLGLLVSIRREGVLLLLLDRDPPHAQARASRRFHFQGSVRSFSAMDDLHRLLRRCGVLDPWATRISLILGACPEMCRSASMKAGAGDRMRYERGEGRLHGDLEFGTD